MCLYPLMLICIPIVFFFSLLSTRCHRKRKWFNGFVFWNWPIMFISESYIVFVICCLINVYNANFETYETRANSITALLLLAFLALYPLIVQLSLYRSRFQLKKRSFKNKYGAAYEDLAITKKRYLYYPLFFYYRRFLLPLIIILMPNYLFT